jgi:hypothetical protein
MTNKIWYFAIGCLLYLTTIHAINTNINTTTENNDTTNIEINIEVSNYCNGKSRNDCFSNNPPDGYCLWLDGPITIGQSIDYQCLYIPQCRLCKIPVDHHAVQTICQPQFNILKPTLKFVIYLYYDTQVYNIEYPNYEITTNYPKQMDYNIDCSIISKGEQLLGELVLILAIGIPLISITFFGLYLFLKELYHHAITTYNLNYHKVIYGLYVFDVLLVSLWGLVDTFANIYQETQDHAIFYISIFSYLISLNKVFPYLERMRIKVFFIFSYFLAISVFIGYCMFNITDIYHKFIILLVTMLPYIYFDYKEQTYFSNRRKGLIYVGWWIIFSAIIGANVVNHFYLDLPISSENFLFFLVYIWIDFLVLIKHIRKNFTKKMEELEVRENVENVRNMIDHYSNLASVEDNEYDSPFQPLHIETPNSLIDTNHNRYHESSYGFR